MTDAKVPWDQAAEEAVLGSMLLSRGSVETALDLIEDPSDFYMPKHRMLFAAIADLYAHESPIDPVTLADYLARADDLEPTGGRKFLVALQARTPASMNVAHYALIVSEHAAARRAIAFADEINDAARDSNMDALHKLTADAEARLGAPHSVIEPARDVAQFVGDPDTATEIPAERFVVADLLARGECLFLTGAEGAGKTTFMRQMQVRASMGRHLFKASSVEPRRTLYVDLQDPEDQIRREYAKFMRLVGNSYTAGSGVMTFKSRQAGIDLATPRDVRWLDALCDHHRPDILFLGPLYNAYEGKPGIDSYSEEIAHTVQRALTRIMTRYDLALVLEGHTVHDGEREGYRPRGSRLWEGWPTFGFGLGPSKRRGTQTSDDGTETTITGNPVEPRYKLVSWRGPRDRSRPWPRHMFATGFESGGWPWTPPANDPSMLPARDTAEQRALGDDF